MFCVICIVLYLAPAVNIDNVASGKLHIANDSEFTVVILTYHLHTFDLPLPYLTSVRSILSQGKLASSGLEKINLQAKLTKNRPLWYI